VKEEIDAKIHLLLVDDHSLFREGLIRLLAAEPDFEIVGNCGHLREAVEIFNRKRVDLITTWKRNSASGCWKRYGAGKSGPES
jgi:PleD family two-component response regulator